MTFRGLRLTPVIGGLLVLSFLQPATVRALDPSRSVFQYNCQTWKRQNGLPANGVNAIAQTTDGYLWLGTPVGLVRFDGTEFKPFDMSRLPQIRSSIVTGLSSSKKGGFWFGLERGAFGYCDGTDITFNGKEEWGGLGQNVHSVIENSDGSVWIAAEGQSGRVLDKSYEVVQGLENSDITAICRGSKDRVWLGTARKGLYIWQRGTATKFPSDILEDRIVRSIVEDSEGRVWVGTELGLICYDSGGKRVSLPYPWYQTTSLLIDSHGAIWVGTSGGGLARYMKDLTISQFRQADGLADDFVSSLAEDKEGSIWIGTRNGLSQLSDVKIPMYGKTEGLTADIDISVAASHKGGFWVGTSEGVDYFDGTAHHYSTAAGLRNKYVKCVYEARNGDVYLLNGSMDVEVLSGGKVVARYTNNVWPTAITEDDQSVVIAAGDLYRIGTNFYTPYAFTNDQRPSISWVFNMTTSKDGAIWIAASDGVYRVKDGVYQLWTKAEGLSDSKAICLAEDPDGDMWVGLETGIARIKHGQVRNVSRQNGLIDNIIYSIVLDDYGSLWAASSRGYFRVQRQSLDAFADGKSDHVQCIGYSELDAVKTFERNQQEPSGCKTSDGKIWFPTAQGIVMIDPTNITTNLVPPPVYVHSVRANGKELSVTNRAVVHPGKGELEFNYAGLSYIAPQKTQYRYKLDGYDKEYVQAGTRRSAFYTNLKPGEYQFHVQACNADGVWGETGADFSLKLLPHFFQTAWFISLMGLSVVFVLFGIYGWRISRLRWKQKQLQAAHDMLETKVKERTAELAESNTSLKTEIEERKRVQKEVERIHQQLVDASRLAGQAEVASSVLHNVGNVLNSVNVSTTLISERLQKMRITNLSKAVQLMQDHAKDIGHFISIDERGKRLPEYLQELAGHLRNEQSDLLTELAGLAHNVEHIKEIVAMQQTYAKVSGTEEKVEISDLVESALKMHAGAYVRHAVKVIREYENIPTVTVDRHKVLQILINLLANAKYACDEGGHNEKKVTVRIKRKGNDRATIEVVDNGVGIPQQNITRIFSHGFTTRKNGHGFGLHSSALAAKEMGGSLTAFSEGTKKGAAFTLELPLQQIGKKHTPEAPANPRQTSLEVNPADAA